MILKHRLKSRLQTIDVFDDRSEGHRIRRLFLDSAEHSAIDLDRPDFPVHIYTDFVYLAWLFNQAPRHVLIAGLGGGTMPMRLRRSHPQVKIDVVEKDPDIVAIAKRYFAVREDSRLHIHVGDAGAHLQKSRRLYDVSILDIYGSRRRKLWAPPAVTSTRFFRHVHRHTRQDGVAIFNVVGQLKGKSDKTLALIRKLEALFPQVYLFPIFLKKAPNMSFKRNILVVCSKQSRRMDESTITRRAQSLSRRFAALRDLPLYAENYYAPQNH